MLYIGIDISKYKHDCIIIDESGVVIRNVFSFDNSRTGFDQFMEMYRSLDSTEIKKIGFEATGHYQDNFKVYLERSGIEFMQLNSLLVHKFKNSQTLRGVKTDKTDARLIANYLSSIEFKPYPKISYHTLALRSLCKRHFDLINERTKHLIRITNFLDRTFPEFKEFIKGNIKSKTAMYILHNYAIPNKIMNINIQSYENIRKESHGHMSVAKFNNLKELAKNTVGFSYETDLFEIKSLLKVYDTLEEEISLVENEITTHMSKINSHIPSILGIGMVSAATMIADMIEPIMPVPNDHLYTPAIENCDNILRDMCFEKAHELYGDPLPEFIQNRLDKELNGIISNGYSVIYYIAHRIIKKANEDGYIVGSRGSVGSSFVATMSNVTEVNPLPPHYRCPKCKHLEWTKETLPQYRSGYDLPEKVCPICGEKMVHDGQDIPFETFLGFNAEKVPDIDLNFPGDYQSHAHDYTKVLLGENNVFRAGTIETVAEKTAFGFARGFLERSFKAQGMNDEDIAKALLAYPKAKIHYLASGCVDVKRTTGQHPGGIVVIPSDHEVYDFTPVQYPADDIDSNWKTTHFDFHSIHDTILKLDLLGHVDPMALKMMCDLTGVKIQDIPMNDEKVLSLFSSAKALGMEHDYTNAKTGALLLPEFNTEFVRGVLEETSPHTFSDLVIISGLTHGTGVWNGNADQLIKDKTATLQQVIGCRDDIMTYLMSKEIPSNIAFMIMEDVRKGRGLKEEYLEIMRAKKVPDFYIESCNKIQYLFPKGHAVAYVTMAVRVGYFKIYYPLEFYATFFTVRSKQYDIHTMIKGKEAIISKIEELRTRQRVSNEKLSPKEQEQLKTLFNALEMVQRGYHFSNINLYRSDATKFVVDYESKSLIPPFITIDGLGENNAITVVEARNDGEFFSKEDLLRRTKLTSTNVQDLADMGVLDDLSESDQLSLFDF